MTTTGAMGSIGTIDHGMSSTPTTSGSGFGNTMDSVALFASSMTPALEASFLASGNTGAASIAALTGNAVYSSSAGAAQMAGGVATNMGGYGSGLAPSGGYMGSSSLTQTGTGTGGVNNDVESILAETATSQSYLIGIQAQMGQQQSTFTAISNALNVKHSMERSAIQNFRS